MSLRERGGRVTGSQHVSRGDGDSSGRLVRIKSASRVDVERRATAGSVTAGKGAEKATERNLGLLVFLKRCRNVSCRGCTLTRSLPAHPYHQTEHTAG